MTSSEGDRMLMRGQWYVARRTAKKFDCSRCALKALGLRHCADYCDTIDYLAPTQKYLLWEREEKPIIPNNVLPKE